MVEQRKKRVGILFELGEARRNRADWPDYKQYGFAREDVEDLLELVTDTSLHGASSESNEVWVPLHAWRAFGQLGDPRAIAPLIGMFDTLCDDDWALEELPLVLAMMGRNAIGALTDYLDDDSHKEFARAMAIGALEEIATRNPSTRNDVVTIITDYLDDPDPNATGLNGSSVSALITLEAQESIGTIRRLYRSGNVDIFVCGDIEDVEIELGLRAQRSTPPPDFAEYSGLTREDSPKRKKIGRNDPCPCGSGKKYKKCCLH
jgi:HEAT repeat protein